MLTFNSRACALGSAQHSSVCETPYHSAGTVIRDGCCAPPTVMYTTLLHGLIPVRATCSRSSVPQGGYATRGYPRGGGSTSGILPCTAGKCPAVEYLPTRSSDVRWWRVSAPSLSASMRAPAQCQKLFELPPRVALDISWGRPERGVGPSTRGIARQPIPGIQLSCFRGPAAGAPSFYRDIVHRLAALGISNASALATRHISFGFCAGQQPQLIEAPQQDNWSIPAAYPA
ncbi:hypothetical protein DHEL01_v209618 [Diaporthe helianthi]|uniref:Uncharacterized protein n=1 Tax=Diaporthe helianthi TaxID=158607 RepID=A0A2P5HP35_DIAHE|nr:hypothetical protein DHEL01_v209618 [Diaporthe helianthi]